MNKSLLNLIFIFFCFYYSPISCKEIPCAYQLKEHLEAIQKLPEARELIEKIQKEGNIQIQVDNSFLSKQFDAYWNPLERIICIGLSKKVSKGMIIGSILFELHNAAVTSKFKQLDLLATQRKISQAEYVKSMEYLEYLNSLSASKMTQKGIKLGIFPADAFLPTYSTFEEHFADQKKSGHSAWFERNYQNCVRHSMIPSQCHEIKRKGF